MVKFEHKVTGGLVVSGSAKLQAVKRNYPHLFAAISLLTLQIALSLCLQPLFAAIICGILSVVGYRYVQFYRIPLI